MKRLFIIFLILFISTETFSQISGKSKTGRLFGKKKIEKKVEAAPPVIILTSPLIDASNKLFTDENSILIEGFAEDKNGIKSIEINYSLIELNSSNGFSKVIDLNPGDNFINIKAVNNEGVAAEKNFSVTLNIQEDLPQIVIDEPMLGIDNSVDHFESIITVRGKVTGDYGIKEVRVNDITATIMQGNSFFANVKLKDGINNIFVTATNVNEKKTQKSFKVITPIDLDGPKITLLEPAVSRGIKVIRKKDVLKVRGTVSDPSGISEVTVNNRRTRVLANNEFSIDMFLAMGENRIIVKAVDNKFNTSTDTFYVMRKLDEIIKSGKYIALVIGINSYEGYWNPLNNAVNDAAELAEVLRSEYSFDEVYTLIDKEATRRNIIQKLEWLTNNVSKDDNVLIFYAGHGQFNKNLNKGYWVPADAKTKSVADYISNNDVKTFIGGIPSKHTLLITDACFAGDIFRGPKTESIEFDPNDMSRYYREVYRKPSRIALTSGSIEPVMDSGRDNHSIFAYYLLKALKENRRKYLDASQLFNEFRMAVANNSEQTPQLNVVRDTDDEGGQFIFIKRDIE
ncbi:MAG: caspase family protein [Ignavibacteriae bacterium]|nr:caspase family protein [Ignavibacteriota bacterium]NOG98245.1 caspase family protein [Ignavibacteriota bacterium]